MLHRSLGRVVCILQHKKNQTVSDSLCNPTPGTGLVYLLPQLLQCSSSRSPSMHSEAPTDGSEQVTMLLIKLPWLPVAAQIKFKLLMLANRVMMGLEPSHINLCRLMLFHDLGVPFVTSPDFIWWCKLVDASLLRKPPLLTSDTPNLNFIQLYLLYLYFVF